MGRELLGAEMLAGHLVPAGSMFAFLAAHRAGVFPDADYADLFAPPGAGRPSLPATRMAAVLASQALHDCSGRETAEAVRFGMGWKVARGLAVDDAGSGPSSLVYWRGRIARPARPHPGPGAASSGNGDSDGGGDPLAWYGDSAYGTGDPRDAIGAAGHEAVIKPKPPRPPAEGRLHHVRHLPAVHRHR